MVPTLVDPGKDYDEAQAQHLIQSVATLSNSTDYRRSSKTITEVYSLYIPVGLYHTPFLGYLTLVLGFQNHRVGYPKTGVWYEPTSRIYVGLHCQHEKSNDSFRVHVGGAGFQGAKLVSPLATAAVHPQLSNIELREFNLSI